MFFFNTFLYVQTKLKLTLVVGMPSSSTESSKSQGIGANC